MCLHIYRTELTWLMHEKKIKTKNLHSACDVSSISEYLLQRLVMMWNVFDWYFKKHAIPSNNGQREIIHVIHHFDGWHIHVAKHSDCKMWLEFGRMENSMTNKNIAYALLGTYKHLWGICDLRDYNFDSWNTKYSFRPTHVWYKMVIGRKVTYKVCSFPLTIIWV